VHREGRRARRAVGLLCAAALAGCGGETAPEAPSEPVTADAAVAAAPVIEELATPDGAEAALAALGAVPAWTAVIDRAAYLERRGQRGAVWGRLADTDDGRWLIDETEGDGALAIRVALPAWVQIAAGRRAVAWGAWTVDDERRWVWRADRVALVPGSEEPATPGAPIGVLAPGVVAAAPDGAVAVSQVAGAGAIVFEVVGAPRRPGDGWQIADGARQPPAALLLLPGEREPYGGQDLLGAGERWSLARGERYTIEVGRFRRPRDPATLPLLRAVSSPRRIDPSAADPATDE
jgi:hypothetical protein